MKNKLFSVILMFLIAELLCGVSCIKSGLKEDERNLIKDVEKFNREYGSKGVTIKNRKIDWDERLRCKGLILKNSLIKNIELRAVDLSNMYMENSRVEDVFLRGLADLSGSTFKNVKFKNIKFEKKIMGWDNINRLEDSIFIDCEFKNGDFDSDVRLGKEYINCKFKKCKIYDYKGRFENVTFEDCVISSEFGLKDSKNVQFINCVLRYFRMSGKAEGILIQNPKVNFKSWNFKEGTFSNVSIINCDGYPILPIIRFNKVNLNNLLIKHSKVSHLRFDEADVSGDNRIENSKIYGNFYGRSKVRNLTITDCIFEDYVNIVFSELIKLRLVNNIYNIEDEKHAVIGEKYIDSDRFPLKSTPFPEDNDYVKRYYYDNRGTYFVFSHSA